ncbi:MAG: DUF4402 domain-containing protein [Flavobacteriaceae bacterium]
MRYFLGLVLGLIVHLANAQDIYVTAEQDLGFGKFFVTDNTHGAISVLGDGSWSVNGNIQHLDRFPQTAIFTIWTEHIEPIKVRVEIIHDILTGSHNNDTYEIVNTTRVKYVHISQAEPAKIQVGGTLIVAPRSGTASEIYRGNVTVRAIKASHWDGG